MTKLITSKKMFSLLVIATIIGTALITIGGLSLLQQHNQSLETQTVAVRPVGSDIVASGTIHSQEEATLHFQTGGKVTYLPFQVGDSVSQGQTIASLDTYTLQQQLTQALNTYRSTRDTFDQTQANVQNGVLQNGQKSALSQYNQSGLSGDTQTNAIADAAKRIVDQNQANLDNAVINVQVANYAIQLATLTAPFSGVITSEDITVANQFVTPLTSFSLANPNLLVFKAQVAATDIDFVTMNAPAAITIDAHTIHGLVTRIYPEKTTLPTGESVYTVDIASASLGPSIVLGQAGVAHIQTVAQENYATIPTWAVVGHNKVWVLKHNKPTLETVTVGRQYGNITTVLGLSVDGPIIINPKNIAEQTYSIL